MLVNDVNFLRWNNPLATPGLPKPPWPYWRDREACNSMVLLKPEEATSFYINTTDGFRWEDQILGFDFNAVRLGIFRAEDGVLMDATLPFEADIIPDTDPLTRYNILSTFVTPRLDDGAYYLKLFYGPDGTEFVRSNFVYVTNDPDILKTTCYFRFRHDRFFYNIRYHALPAFYQQFRLNIGIIDEQPDDNVSTYTASTTGKTRIPESVEKWAVKFESRFFDPDAHRAATVMIKHKYLEINGSAYAYKTGYKINTRVNTKLNKGEFELYDEAFSSINRC